MSKIKQLLIMHRDGASNRSIARILGMDKETVNNYVNKTKALPEGLEGLLMLEDPELERRLHNGNAAYSDPRFDEFREMLPYIEGELRRKGVTLRLLWEEYRAEHPEGYGLTQFRFHYRQYAKAKGSGGHSTVVKDLYAPGERLMIDFAGDKLPYVDVDTGEEVKVEVFVACMPATDFVFATCVPTQNSEDFLFAITQCLKAMGGVPKILVPDNLKAAVYRHIYALLRNRVFHSIEELNKAVGELVRAYNQRRMQQLNFTREERFLSLERPALTPLPAQDFEIKSYASLKVGYNCCVYLGRDKHYYSVPHQLVGKQTQVIYTRSLVRVFCDGDCVAVHKQDRRPGEYSILKEHLASSSNAYRSRSPQYYEEKARAVSDELAEVIRLMFLTSRVPPETFYKGCDGLLKLQRTTRPDLFKRACETALDYGRYRYGFIKSLVDSDLAGVETVDDLVKSPPSNHANVRGKGQFN